MAPQVSITVAKEKQVVAARALSTILDTLGIKHAFIGGFAVALYGGARRTKDIDILVDIPANDIRDFLRPRVTEINGHFAQSGLKYYFVPTLVDGLQGEQLVLANQDNTLIETLPTHSLGLPMTITPSMILHREETEDGSAISKRTFPPSVLKASTDRHDISFLIKWLAERDLKISVPAYNAAEPGRLYEALKAYEEFLKENEEAEELAQFMAVS
ncbi:hypothetical protein MMC07_008405 [Pseudocyphellaria aurata]|nr:hypothetical protein [Pseudocyphellaria aurata]